MQYININKSSKFGRQFGFTLIEIMVVVIIMSILAVLIVPNLFSRVDDARVVKAKTDIASIQTALGMYRIDSGLFPSTEQGLDALYNQPSIAPMPINWRGPYQTQKLILDPWGSPYQYRSPGKHGEIDIFSFGPKKETAQESEYIGNWSLN